MQKYQSHKIVEAGKITRFDASHDADGEKCFDIDVEGHAGVFVIDVETGERILHAAGSQGLTPLGGHLMLYKDGYISWAPDHTMEDYDLVQPSSGKSKIEGYRELTANEVGNMNAVKVHGKQLGDLVDAMRNNETLDQRWVSVGATDLQKGLMALTRAIAKPEFF